MALKKKEEFHFLFYYLTFWLRPAAVAVLLSGCGALLLTVCTANTLSTWPSPPAVPAGPAAGGVGAAAETHPPVLPHRRLRLHLLLQGVRLQTPLERRAVRPSTGGAGGHPGGEFLQPLFFCFFFFGRGVGWKHKSRKLPLFYVFICI